MLKKKKTNKIKIRKTLRKKSVKKIPFPKEIYAPLDMLAVETPRRAVVYSSFKALGVLTAVLVFFISFINIGGTVSYYRDTEISSGNLLKAGALNLKLEESENKKQKPEIYNLFEISVDKEEDSLPFSYVLSGEILNENDPSCDQLWVKAVKDEYRYKGLLKDFSTSSDFEMGKWYFMVFIPGDSTIPPGEMCSGNIVFHADYKSENVKLAGVFNDKDKYYFEIYNHEALEPEGVQVEAGDIIQDNKVVTEEELQDQTEEEGATQEEEVNEEIKETENTPPEAAKEDPSVEVKDINPEVHPEEDIPKESIEEESEESADEEQS